LAGANNTGTIFEYNSSTNAITGKYSFATALDGKDFGDVLSLVGCDKPTITTQPQDIQTCPGSNVDFNFTANGSNLSYQWYKKGVLLPNDTNTTLNFTNIAFADTGSYHCVVKNSCGHVLTKFVKINVQNVPVATITPQGPATGLCLDDNVSLLSISGAGLTYQWNFNGAAIIGETNISYTADSVNASGNYSVTVSTGPGCDNTSSNFNVGFLPFTFPTITATASTDTICLSAAIAFTTSITDGGPIPLFQWYLNNVPVVGQTGAIFNTSTLQNNDIVNVHFTSTASCVEPSLSTIITSDIIIVDTCLVAPTISTGTVLGAPFCQGTQMMVPFTTSGNFNIGNVFTAELSDASGNFTSPIVIGQLTAISSGMILCTVPSVNTSSTNYKVRVVANNPSATSTVSNDIEIRSSNFGLQFTASSTNITTAPSSVTLNNTTPNLSNYTFNWFYGDGQQTSNNNANVLYTYGYNGLYDVTLLAQDNAGCTDTLFKDNYITVNAPGQPGCNQTVNTNPSGIVNACVGSLVPLNSTTNATNANYQWNRNGVPIGGASQQDYLVSTNGNYSLTVFNQNACPQTSSTVQVLFSQAASPLPIISSTGTVSGCGNVNLTLTASGSFAQFLWSNGQTGTSINVTQGGVYSVTGQSPACDAVSLPFNVNGSIAPVPEICMITVDTLNELNQNYIIWQKPVSNLIDKFIVYREDTLASNSGIFYEIGRVDYVSDSSAFLDTTSYAKRRSYRYKLGVLDTCNGYTISSSVQRSMHLQNVPGNNILQRYIYWNSYEGQPQGITQYLIYRENYSLAGYELIDTVPATQTWYIDNDLTSLNDTLRKYSVAYELAVGCDVTRAARRGCNSNSSGHERIVLGAVNAEVEAANYEVNLFPNPTAGLLYIQVESSTIFTKLNQIEIKDITGRVLIKKEIDVNRLNTIDLGNLTSGCYFVSTFINNTEKTKKILIQK
jgi:hypothetical protein